MKKPTLGDVASLAGVSTASASRVLNKTGSASGEMCRKVETAAGVLNYQRSPSPARLTESRELFDDQTIALVITDALNPYFYAVIQGAQEEAENCDLFILVANATPDPDHQLETVRRLMARSQGGVILGAIDVLPKAVSELYEEYRCPLVILNLAAGHPEIPSIMVDFGNAAGRVTQHLLDLGHTDIAYLAGPSHTEPSRERRRGIDAVLHAHGMTLHPEWCPHGVPSIEGGFRAMISVIRVSAETRPTAVIVYNDVMAIGALQAARTLGLRVPEDVSIVGFDNIPMAAHTNPPLTTVAVPTYQMGRVAVQVLCQMRQGQVAHHGYALLECSMIVRDSSGPPPDNGS